MFSCRKPHFRAVGISLGLVLSCMGGNGHAELLLPASALRCAPLIAAVSETGEDLEIARVRLNVDEAYEKIKSLRGKADVSILGKSEGFDIYKIHFPARDFSAKPFRVIVTAGVHGREPIGVDAAFAFIDDIVQNPDRYGKFDITILPMLNPAGLKDFLRTMRGGQNLNRSFIASSWNEASRLVRDSFYSSTFDLAVDLHGSVFNKGFFIIKSGDDRGSARQALDDLRGPLLQSENGNYPDYSGDSLANAETISGPRYLLIAPGEVVSNNEGTLKTFWHQQGVPLSYTVEAPGRLDLSVQRSGLLNLLRLLLFRSNGLTAS